MLDVVCTQVQQYGAKDFVVLARLLSMLREVAWTTSVPEHRRAIADHLVRLRQAAGEQDFDAVRRSQIDHLARAVGEALDRRWAPTIR